MPLAIGAGVAWLLVLVLCAWAYAPGLQGPSLLDDQVNLARLTKLGEQPEFAGDVAMGNRSGFLGRPLSMWSFTLEKLYLDRGLYGIKRSNLVIHLVNGTLMYLLFLRLFSVARLPSARALACCGAAAWLLSPLYVSTVLYSVQRMAQLSTLGVLGALLAYAEWRVRLIRGDHAWWLLALVPCCALAALLAKGNGVVALPMVLLLEWLWFDFAAASVTVSQTLRRCWNWLAGLGVLVALAGLLWLWPGLINSYARRDFTLYERVLTQSRALWDYLGQLLWPDVARMGVFHDDYPVSQGLASPAATGWSVLAWLLVICAIALPIFGQGRLRQVSRLLLCGVGLYLLGQAVESSVLPLELYFEHRAYLSGVGLFLLLGVAVGLLLRGRPALRPPMLVAVALALGTLLTLTGSQAALWSTRDMITLTSLNAHPDSVRTNVEMAALLARRGQLDASLRYSTRAHSLRGEADTAPLLVRNLVLTCLADKSPPADLLQAFSISPAEAQHREVNSNMRTLTRLLLDQHCAGFDMQALTERLAEIFLVTPSASSATRNLFTLMAQLENHLGNYQRAYDYTALLLEKSPGDTRGLSMQLYFATALGREDEAAAIGERLGEMERLGLLSAEERHNLSLLRQ